MSDTVSTGDTGHEAEVGRDEPQGHRIQDVRGWLLFFCVTLLVVNPVSGISSAWSEMHLVTTLISDNPSFVPLIVVESLVLIALAVWSFAAGLGLLMAWPSAVSNAKRFLMVVLVSNLALSGLPLALGLPESETPRLTKDAMRGAFQSLVYFGIWLTYLVRSKRVAKTYASELEPQSS